MRGVGGGREGGRMVHVIANLITIFMAQILYGSKPTSVRFTGQFISSKLTSVSCQQY